jgi:cobalt-zinc-cadmium efflux system protein
MIDSAVSEKRNPGSKRRLTAVLVLVCGYMVAEVAGGLWTNSLALLADAGHMLSDAAALALSLFAIWIAERPPDARRTYGYYRMEILAALANGAALVAVAVLVLVEAYGRLRQPPEVMGGAMMAIAFGGLAVNLVSLRILGGGSHESLNVRGAWLHVLGDTLGSVGAILAGTLIWAFGWNWADPLISALIAALIVYSSWRLLAESVSVLMESAPRGVDVDRVRDALAAVPGVRSVHDLHVWTITSGMDSLSAHLVVGDGHPATDVLLAVRHLLAAAFGIHHVTIQIEPEDFVGHAACPHPNCR